MLELLTRTGCSILLLCVYLHARPFHQFFSPPAVGTDTMAYAASALSFILENLDKTIIMTGSMLPLSDLFNDAQRNLVVSIIMAATLSIPEGRSRKSLMLRRF